MGEERNYGYHEKKILKSFLYQKRTKKKTKDRIIRDILKLSETEEEKEEINKSEKKEKENERLNET